MALTEESIKTIVINCVDLETITVNCALVRFFTLRDDLEDNDLIFPLTLYL